MKIISCVFENDPGGPLFRHGFSYMFQLSLKDNSLRYLSDFADEFQLEKLTPPSTRLCLHNGSTLPRLGRERWMASPPNGRSPRIVAPAPLLGQAKSCVWRLWSEVENVVATLVEMLGIYGGFWCGCGNCCWSKFVKAGGLSWVIPFSIRSPVQQLA